MLAAQTLCVRSVFKQLNCVCVCVCVFTWGWNFFFLPCVREEQILYERGEWWWWWWWWGAECELNFVRSPILVPLTRLDVKQASALIWHLHREYTLSFYLSSFSSLTLSLSVLRYVFFLSLSLSRNIQKCLMNVYAKMRNTWALQRETRCPPRRRQMLVLAGNTHLQTRVSPE